MKMENGIPSSVALLRNIAFTSRENILNISLKNILLVFFIKNLKDSNSESSQTGERQEKWLAQPLAT